MLPLPVKLVCGTNFANLNENFILVIYAHI